MEEEKTFQMTVNLRDALSYLDGIDRYIIGDIFMRGANFIQRFNEKKDLPTRLLNQKENPDNVMNLISSDMFITALTLRKDLYNLLIEAYESGVKANDDIKVNLELSKSEYEILIFVSTKMINFEKRYNESITFNP